MSTSTASNQTPAALESEIEERAEWQTNPGAVIVRVTARINELIANLPPLTGSEKQRDWGNQIRIHFANSFLRYHEEQAAYQHPGATAAGLAHGLPAMIKILAITESEFWIQCMRRKIAGASIDLHEITAERWIARHSYK